MGNELPEASKPEALSPSENSKSRKKENISLMTWTAQDLCVVLKSETDTNLHHQNGSFYFCPLIFHLASAVGREVILN